MATTDTTIIRTVTTENTIVKRQSTSSATTEPKRFKRSVDDDHTSTIENDTRLDLSSDYQRIYLKCFICAKRDYIDARMTNSDMLHSHWMVHGANLLLNIYDSEIDSILTRVVEFFHSPKRHSLEGNIKTIFILNSREVRASTTTVSSDDSCILID